MADRPPLFADYHRTVVGYHGTLRSTAIRLVTGEQPFTDSVGGGEWLGHGVYFWEYSPRQAWRWAADHVHNPHAEPVAVVASMIRLGNCFDLVDPENAHRLEEAHRQFVEDARRSGKTPPKNARAHKLLDCAVLNYAYASIAEAEGVRVDTCRAVYVPSKLDRFWPTSWLCRGTHLQLCVMNPECILGTWLVRARDEGGDDGEGQVEGRV